MNSDLILWILLSEFIYLWIHICIQNLNLWTHTHEFIYSWIYRSFHKWIHIAYEFTWSFHVWIHMYMNSNIWIHTYKIIWTEFIYESIWSCHQLWFIWTMNSYDFFIYEFILFMNSCMNLGVPRFRCTWTTGLQGPGLPTPNMLEPRPAFSKLLIKLPVLLSLFCICLTAASGPTAGSRCCSRFLKSQSRLFYVTVAWLAIGRWRLALATSVMTQWHWYHIRQEPATTRFQVQQWYWA